MNVSGIDQYGGLYSSYPSYDIPSVDVSKIREQELERQKQEQSISLPETISYNSGGQSADERSRIANLEDISLTFQKNESFDFIGQDSDIFGLDIQKAVSDLNKDSIIQEYQYFVGNTFNTTIGQSFSSSDGTVINKGTAQTQAATPVTTGTEASI